MTTSAVSPRPSRPPVAVDVGPQQPLILKRSDSLEAGQDENPQAAKAAREAKRRVDLDVQTELAFDAANRAKDDKVALATRQLGQAQSQNQLLQQQLDEANTQVGAWRWGTGGAVVSSLLFGALWLRARRVQQAEQRLSDSLRGFDTSDVPDIDSQVNQSALLPEYAEPTPEAEQAAPPSWLTRSQVGLEDYAAARVNTAEMSQVSSSHPVDHEDSGLYADSGGEFVDSLVPASQRPLPGLTSSTDVSPAHADHQDEVRGRGVWDAYQEPDSVAPDSQTEPQSTRPPETGMPAIKSESAGLASRDSGASAFSATEMHSSAAEATAQESIRRGLPDLQFVPQPMQDLLLIHRGLQEWEREGRWGVAEQALLHHLAEHQGTSGWAYLELLAIYKRKNDKASFQHWSNEYRARFNRLPPTWSEAALPGRELLRYDLATVQLTQAWANNSVIWLLEQWLVGEPHMRRLMDLAAFRDVMMLYELSMMVNDSPYSPLSRARMRKVNGAQSQ